MKQYLELCKHVLENGNIKGDRTGTGTISVFGYQNRYNLQEGFPLATTKDMSGIRFDGIATELIWFLNGDTNIKFLVDNGINIWNPDAYRDYSNAGGILSYSEFVDTVKEPGSLGWDLGPVYGKQWRRWEKPSGVFIDQVANLIGQIKSNPNSRRLIISAWNVSDLDNMSLPPCHTMFQFYVADGKLSCQLYQRSGDVFLGVPYNIASYALLVHIIAQQTDLEVGEFVHTFGDLHIYNNHVEQVKLQLTREPKELPRLIIKRKPDSISDYKREDFILLNYTSHPSIKGKQST